jgi:hypothetical protein
VGVLWPAVGALRQTNFLFTQGFPVGGAGVVLVRGPPADVAVHDEERRPVSGGQEAVKRPAEQLLVVGVGDPDDIPAVTLEAAGGVVGKRQGGVALDGDVVVVVDPAEVGEPQVSRQRRRLVRDALHHAAVAAQGVDVKVDQVLEPGPIEARGHPPAGDGHAHAGGQSLAERAGGGLDAAGPAVLRVTGAAAVQLPEALDRLQRYGRLTQRLVLLADRLHPGQVQQRVQQHRGVARREDEAVAVGPDQVLRVEAQEVLPQAVGHRRHGHRRARVPGVGRLDGIHGQGPDGVDAEFIDRGVPRPGLHPAGRGRPRDDRLVALENRTVASHGLSSG